MRCSKRHRQQGNTIIEFALVSVFLVPLLLGTINVGMNLSRSIQVTQVSRDAGHMFVRWVDFSLPGNQDIIVRLAYGLGMERTSGNGKVVLTKIMYVGQLECEAGGLDVGQCPNFNQPVIMQRLVIGESSLRDSSVGEPDPGLLDGQGNLEDYLTAASARSPDFDSILALQPGEFAYVSEAYFESPDYGFPGFGEEDRGIYTRTIF